MPVNPRWPPTFNIIYVPGAVYPVLDFARSLADHSPYRFRLVSNACTAEEEAFIAKKAATHPRLEVSTLESKTILPHGEALQRLFRRESAEYFAFIDSDIFARGPFLTDAQALLVEHAAVFSGLPTWLPEQERVMPAHFVSMGGRFTRADDGRCLGASYCALYQRNALERVMDRTGVTFHAQRWSDLSSGQRTRLSKMRLEKRRYDTTKLVNLMLGHSGFSLVVRPEPNLVHLVGLSSVSVWPSGLSGRIMRRIRGIVRESWPGSVPRRSRAERRAIVHIRRRRRLVEDYFQHLLAGGAIDEGPALFFPASGRPQLVEMGREFLALRRRYGSDDGIHGSKREP